MSEDSRKPKRLTPPCRLWQPVFSPDGSYLAFTSGAHQNDIFIRRLESFERRQLTINAGYHFGLAFSPNGTQIAFVRQDAYYEENNNIHIISIDGTGERQLTYTNRDSGPTFSPDGRHIVFVSLRNGRSSEIYSVDLESGAETKITHSWSEDDPRTGRGPRPRNFHPRFSPDGKQIVFESWRHNSGKAHQEIYTMKPDGTEQTRLTYTTGTCKAPDYSPDGQQIAFLCHPFGSRKNYIHTVKANGSDRTQRQASEKVEDIAAHRFNFSPDSRRIVFTGRNAQKSGAYGQDFDIFLLNVQNGEVRRLTDNADCDRDAVFSPDGRKIAFVSNREGAEAIYMMDVEPIP